MERWTLARALPALAAALFIGCGKVSQHKVYQLGPSRTIEDIYAGDEGPASIEARIAASVAAEYVWREWRVRVKPLLIHAPTGNAYDVRFIAVECRDVEALLIRVTPGSWEATRVKQSE